MHGVASHQMRRDGSEEGRGRLIGIPVACTPEDRLHHALQHARAENAANVDRKGFPILPRRGGRIVGIDMAARGERPQAEGDEAQPFANGNAWSEQAFDARHEFHIPALADAVALRRKAA